MAAQVSSRCSSRSSAGSSNTGTRRWATPGALGGGCWRETLTHSVTPARASASGPAAARALPRKSPGATRTKGGGAGAAAAGCMAGCWGVVPEGPPAHWRFKRRVLANCRAVTVVRGPVPSPVQASAPRPAVPGLGQRRLGRALAPPSAFTPRRASVGLSQVVGDSLEPPSPSVAPVGQELGAPVAPDEEQKASPLSGDGQTVWSPAGSGQRSPSEPPEEEMLDFCRDLELDHVMQEWQDGCVYQGELGHGMRMGCGQFSWPTGEVYRGQFYRDHRHGVGTYMWPDGSSFTGTFYLSSREGYGTMYLKPSVFKGLYKADRRFGPGFETYTDGSQDVGLWLREHLIQLCTPVPMGFSMQDHPEFSSFLSCTPARARLSDEPRAEQAPGPEPDPFPYPYKQLLQDDGLALPPDMDVYSTDSGHLPLPASMQQDLDTRIFLSETPPPKDEKPWAVKNETPLLVQMQRHAYRFRHRTAHGRWRMDAILAGDRTGFGQPGPKEQLAAEMILKAGQGDLDWVRLVLQSKHTSPDVADSRGYCALASAAVHCHTDIVQLLLDYGADVNKCSDEGLTPLAMCVLLYYPAWTFKCNVAERTVSLFKQDITWDTPRLAVCSAHTLSNVDMGPQPVHREDSVPTAGPHEVSLALPPAPLEGSFEATSSAPEMSWESSELWSSLQDWSSSHGDSLSDLELDLDVRSGHQGKLSSQSLFESMLCVRNFSVRLSRDIVERGVLASYGLHRLSSLQCSDSSRGGLWKMVQSMAEQRSRWSTICMLLRRGADPNLSRVPMPVLFFAVKAGDVDGVRLLLESGARTDIHYPPELRSLTPLHIAAALPGEEGTKITELLLHAITDVDARASDQEELYKPHQQDLQPSTMKLSGELGPPSNYYNMPASGEGSQGGRTPLHVACERNDNEKHAQDVVQLLLSHKANPNLLWSGHSPLSLAIVSRNDLIVKELLTHGADPNLLLTKGLGSALCVACDISCENHRSLDSSIALIDRLISFGADILNPVTLTQGDRVAVGTAVDYGYFRFFQDRRISHSAFHTLLPHERDTLVAWKRLLEHMGFLLRSAVLAREAHWEPRVLYLSKRAELIHYNRLRRKGLGKKMSIREDPMQPPCRVPFFKFCYQCGRSVGVRLVPCVRCYGVLTCSKSCKGRLWVDIHKKECGQFQALGAGTHYHRITIPRLHRVHRAVALHKEHASPNRLHYTDYSQE
ncbi:ankyrin repeat and MYND domain-containing protein 1 [Sorex araneus]|uniref:ankyrin repeat and MYND domain-containing protein 1 n=1 Tax=Sorex araneus TaxID=42254 RepID=UPI0024335C1A|nr:ankyrin repeat and MYND domain-containing protein 1 [Sorex araneus]